MVGAPIDPTRPNRARGTRPAARRTSRGCEACGLKPIRRATDVRHVRRVAVILASILLVVPAIEAWAGEGPPPGRLGVGDSIMRSASDELRAAGWRVNAEVGRQFSTGVRVVRWKAARGRLPRRVIVHLGTNGPIDPADCEELVDLVVPRRRLFLVTVTVPRGWEDANNDALRACAAAHERVHLIRWHGHSLEHGDWFASDGYHLTAAGQAEYAAFLDARVDAIVSARAAQRAR